METRLYKFCHKEAATLCGAAENWFDPNAAGNVPAADEDQEVNVQRSMVFSCLYHHYKLKDGVSIPFIKTPWY